MNKTNLSKVKVPEILQVVVFVEDLQKSMEAYWNILGIGPWDLYAWEAPLVHNLTYHGKPSQARERLAFARVGTLELELIEHIDGDSLYVDFIRERGEGIHQLDFNVGDVDKVVKILTNEGFPCLQSGHFGDNGAYGVVDVQPLHVLWEPCHMADNMGIQPVRYPPEDQESQAKVKVTEINAICFVVKDIQKSMEAYWNILGIGPWDIYAWEAPLVHDLIYRGRNVRRREKVAITQVGSISLELYQPVEGNSCHLDFLNEKGEGVHHLSFAVDDVDKVVKILTSEGFPCLQSGHWGDDGAFALIDVKPLHCIWEPFRAPNNE